MVDRLQLRCITVVAGGAVVTVVAVHGFSWFLAVVSVVVIAGF